MHYISKGLILNDSAMLQVLAWQQSGDKLWREPISTYISHAHLHTQV